MSDDALYRSRLALRARALSEGVDLIGWPLDPMDLSDAHLSITRLGAIAERYLPDTERLLTEWWIRRPHVERRVLAGTMPRLRAMEAADAPVVESSQPDFPPGQRRVWLAVAAAGPAAAVREAFIAAFAAGYRIVDFQLETRDRGRYLLAKRDS